MPARIRATSVSGARSRRRSRRAPAGEQVASMTPSSVACLLPETDSVSSKCCCATRSINSVVDGSKREMRRTGKRPRGSKLEQNAAREPPRDAPRGRASQRPLPLLGAPPAPRPRTAQRPHAPATRAGCAPPQRRSVRLLGGGGAPSSTSRGAARLSRRALAPRQAGFPLVARGRHVVGAKAHLGRRYLDKRTKIVGGGGQLRRVRHKPRRDDAHDHGGNDAFTWNGPHLLADRHLLAQLEQARDVAVRSMIGTPPSDLVGLAAISAVQVSSSSRAPSTARHRRTSRRKSPQAKEDDRVRMGALGRGRAAA